MIHRPLQCHAIGLSFPQKTCFRDFTTQIHPGSHIAIIGRNGSGKSTLLRILQGQSDPSEGSIHIPEDVAFGTVPQVIDACEHFALSGGQRFQTCLSHALALQPNFLALDEPTNHLDQHNRASLMRMLRGFPDTWVVVSHDVELLRTCPNIIWHIDGEQIHVFSGNYDDYSRENTKKRTAITEEWTRLERQKSTTHQQLMTEQRRAKQSRMQGEKHIKERKWPTITSSAKARRAEETSGSKEHQIEQKKRMVLAQLSNMRLPEILTPKFTLNTAHTHSNSLISVFDGAVYYGEKRVLEAIHLSVAAGERIAILGNNGSGKSTLIKALLGDPSVQKTGDWTHPKREVIGLLDQHYATLNPGVDPEKTVLDVIQNAAPHWDYATIRCHLNDFLFRKNEEVQALVAGLSGGEKARLSLAQMAARTPLLLILDEITNNLDLETRNHVIQVLKETPCAMIIISHDRDFLDATAITTSIHIEGGRLHS